MKKLIIFDMDNTMIHSHINFPLLKSQTCRILREAGLSPNENQPVTQILAGFKQQNMLSPQVEGDIWQAIDEIEKEGLAGAVIEPQAKLVLDMLAGRAHLTLLTNTGRHIAQAALSRLGLAVYFEHIMGRGNAPQLKPAPGGMLALVAAYPHLRVADALAVGDAAIDIRAAREGGLRFCAYNRSRTEDWQAAGFKPDGQLYAWDEHSADTLMALLEE